MDRKQLTAIEQALWTLYKASLTGGPWDINLWNTYCRASTLILNEVMALDAADLEDIRQNGT